MRERYRTVQREADGEITEKRSRFIAHARPVKSEEEAIAFIEEIRKSYWDARHNVYAYIIEENSIQRYSDDGEPAGTAGVPVLEILKKEDLSNVVVVVTRYFGGILLGTGGLVHAYSKAAKAGIEAAGPVEMVLSRELMLSCEYTVLGKLQNELAQCHAVTGEAVYTDSVKISVFLPVSETESFKKGIIDKTNGRIEIECGGTEYIMR